jgi:hypothetical protein
MSILDTHVCTLHTNWFEVVYEGVVYLCSYLRDLEKTCKLLYKLARYVYSPDISI